jgi:protein-tyrosine phosphatase
MKAVGRFQQGLLRLQYRADRTVFSRNLSRVMSEIRYEIPTDTAGRLAILPRPRGGDWLETEVSNWSDSGIDTVVSLLTPDEVAEFELTNEGLHCDDVGMTFRAFPIPDRGIPGTGFGQLVQAIVDDLRLGRMVGIHCRQGIGRSSLVALAVLNELGRPISEAIRIVSDARGVPVPETPEQRDWIVLRSQQPLPLPP